MKHLFLSLLLLCTSAVLADGVKIGDLYYNLNEADLTAEVTYQYKGLINYSELPKADLEVPESVIYDQHTYTVTAIGYQAFVYCSVITTVTLPSSIREIGANAFMQCTKLRKISIPNTVRAIGTMAFYNCTRLTAFTVPDSVRQVRGSTFEGCTSLVHISLPDSMTALFDGALKNCSALRQIILPAGLTAIGKDVFNGNTALQAIYCQVDSPLVVTNNFTGVDTLTCKLYVPEGSIDAYRQAKVWRDFRYILPLPDELPDAIHVTTTDRLVEPKKILDNNQLVIQLPNGIRYTVTGIRIR